MINQALMPSRSGLFASDETESGHHLESDPVRDYDTFHKTFAEDISRQLISSLKLMSDIGPANCIR